MFRTFRAGLGITEPPGAFPRNYGKLRRSCVSFVITKSGITKKAKSLSKSTLAKSYERSKDDLWVTTDMTTARMVMRGVRFTVAPSDTAARPKLSLYWSIRLRPCVLSSL